METLLINTPAIEKINLEDNELSELRKMFTSLFKKNNIANEDFIVHLEKNPDVPPRCFELFSHIINVHELWLNRITNVHDGEVRPWRLMDTVDYTLKNEDNYYISLGLLASESYGKNYNWSFTYTNHEGIKVIANLSDAYFHILSHSTYHRGQIAYLLKQHGKPLPETEFNAPKKGKSLL